MSEKYVTLSTFKYGLDGRRDALSNVPGTLAQIVNAHINAGGEIEQRQSFVKSAHTFPTNTFGLQDTDLGLVTFGSDASPNAALPAGVTYQRLTPPNGAGGMTTVWCSCNYLGKAFAVAGFSGMDAMLFFYDGVLVDQSRSGEVILGETVANLASDLAAQFNAIVDSNGQHDWHAYANFAVIGGVVTAYNGAVVVTSPPGVHFTPICSVTRVALSTGQLSAVLVDQNAPSTPKIGATVTFTLALSDAGPGNGTVTITAPAAADGSGTDALTGGAVNWNTSLTQTAADIVSIINLLSGSTGYTAVSSGATITVTAPASFGNFTSNLTVVTTGDIITTAGGGTPANPFLLNLSPGDVTNNKPVSTFSSNGSVVAVTETAGATGNNGPVTFQWEEVNTDGTAVSAANASGIQLSSATGSLVTFSKFLSLAPGAPANTVTGYFKCTATDTHGNIARRQFTVKLGVFNFHV